MTMTNGVYDSYQLEQGLKPAYDMTIATAVFEYDTNYHEGKTLCLIIKGMDSDGDEQRLLYPCTTGWVGTDGGARAIREDGAQNRTFNQNSGVGGLIAAAIACGAPLRERGPATSASIWPGLTFRFERKTINADNEQFKTTRALPVAFLGIGQPGSMPGTTAATAAPVVPGTAPAAAPAAAPVAGLDKLTEMKLKAMAKQCATHDQFIEAGLSLAANNPVVEVILSDPNWYEAAKVGA